MVTSSVCTAPSLPLTMMLLTQLGTRAVNQPFSFSVMALPGQVSKALVPSGSSQAQRLTVFHSSGT